MSCGYFKFLVTNGYSSGNVNVFVYINTGLKGSYSFILQKLAKNYYMLHYCASDEDITLGIKNKIFF